MSRSVAASPISRGSTLIAMMQTADLGESNNITRGGKLYATRPWAVLVEREMRSDVMMILKIVLQDAPQMTLVEDDNVIETFTADRTDEPFGLLDKSQRLAVTLARLALRPQAAWGVECS